jgi:aminoglycoside phosphotransferase (APT) family kinase protein
MNVTDQAREVRPGEELDAAKVRAFLEKTVPGLRGDVAVRQFPSGYSNLTYLLIVGDQELVLRRPPFGRKAKTAHDMGREFRILTALHPVFPYCPKPLAYSEDTSIIGSAFYVMERIKGIILRRDPPPGLSLTPVQVRGLCERLLDVQVELHAIDYRKVGLEGFGKPEGYVRRQVTGWSERYRAARTPDAPDCEKIMNWLEENLVPDATHSAVVHNDFKFDNVVLDPEDPLRIIGILDWEMATIGDPLMDLGNSMAYWIQRDDPAELHLVRTVASNMEGALTREEMIARYSQQSGRPVQHFDFYYCFGLFRLAVIAQQIYYRYYHGQTQDERFQVLVQAVHVLDRTARQVIEGPHS